MYKIIHEGKVIDVIRVPKFLKFISKNNIALASETTAEGVASSDGKTAYSFGPCKKPGTKQVKIEPITETEFSRLNFLLNSGQTSNTNDELNEAKQNTIARLSVACKNSITEGFTIALSNGKPYHFRLTAEDQLNLIQIESQLNAGVKSFIYHATNQPCEVFFKYDMIKIINAYRKHVEYHTTYFNCAKHFIKSLQDLTTINLFTYGDSVVDSVSDETIRKILSDGGVKYEG